MVTDCPTTASVSAPSAESGAPINLETYYTEAGMDYRAWSRAFNMHFGYWRWPRNPFALEAMLVEMSRQVFLRLRPDDGDRVLDLGCGVGAPARTLIAGNSVAVTALTRVPWQLLLRRSRLSRAWRNHVIACVISPAIGLPRRWFGYYLITARKRDHRHALVE